MARATSKEAMKHLDEAVTDTILFFDKIDKNDIPTLCKAYKQLYDFHAKIEESYKLLSTLKQDTSYITIPEALETAGFDSVTVGSFLYSVGVRTNASINKDKKEEAFDWLRENNLSALIQEGVNARTLSSAVKEYIETTAKKPPEDLISLHQQKYTSVRKK